MSDYKCRIKVLKTGEIKDVYARDNYFGSNRYGYEDRGKVYKEDEIEFIAHVMDCDFEPLHGYPYEDENGKTEEDKPTTNMTNCTRDQGCSCMQDKPTPLQQLKEEAREEFDKEFKCIFLKEGGECPTCYNDFLNCIDTQIDKAYTKGKVDGNQEILKKINQ